MTTPFHYYTDGEYEYRVARGLDNSGVRATGCAGMRKWSLAQRDLAAPEIVVSLDIDRGAEQQALAERVADLGSRWRQGM